MCIILIQMPDGILLQMQDLFFPNSFLLLLLLCKSCFFLTSLVRTRPLPCSHSRRVIGRPVAGNYASNCPPPSLLPNSQTWWASTTHCTHSKVSEPSDKIKKEHRLHSLAVAPGNCCRLLSYGTVVTNWPILWKVYVAGLISTNGK